ncbi:MAG: hypothetical protein ACE5IG_06585 [Dehalococcoidia bacterium]
MARKRYEQPLTLHGFLWSLPNTLLGLLLALLSLARPQLIEACPERSRGRMLLCTGDRGLAHLLLARRSFSALTLGRVVTAVGPLSHETWVHEVEHARQAELWGIFLLPAYLAYHLLYGYKRNPFEVAAVRVAESFRADHPDLADQTLP